METDTILGIGTLCFFGLVFLIGLYLVIFKAVPAPERPNEYAMVNEV